MAVNTPEEELLPPAVLHPEVQKASQKEGNVAEDVVGGDPVPPSRTETQGEFQISVPYSLACM